MSAANGNGGGASRPLSEGEVFELLDAQARELLGVPAERALEMLRAGDLDDTVVGTHLASIARLLRASERVSA